MAGLSLHGLRGLRIRNRRDAVIGAIYLVVGSGFAWTASGYEQGTAARMGAGYFPFWLGVILIALGALVLFRAADRRVDPHVEANADPYVEATAWRTRDLRALIWMTGAVVLFGFIIKPLGLVLAIVLLVVAASLASPAFTWRGTLINAAVLAAINAIAFGIVLGLPLELWPTWPN